MVILSSTYSMPFDTSEHYLGSVSPQSIQFKRLASQCYIPDYAAWLERQRELMMWLDLAKFLKLPIEESTVVQQELEQIRLQYECLRVIERLPVSVGPGKK